MHYLKLTTLQYFVLLGLVTFSGCSPASQAGPTALSSPIQVKPALIELGEVQSSQGVMTFSFDLKNDSRDAIQVEIQPGCGCTTMDQISVLIHARASHTAQATVSLHGRVGEFHSVIGITSRTTGANPQKWTDLLPIHAYISNHWRASPQRVILESGEIATVSISAPQIEWEHIETQLIGQDIEFQQTSASTQGGIETRVFQVTAKRGEIRGGNRGIGFRRGAEGPFFFTVPVLLK